ncbi:MAG: GlsB/YeaQ/YmgE family stress response membrane protein [Deltaproteobacteria bacterium]|nr:GlsB/YeaQ/YmgE family stress response membrane protein [Deltaproteobacteria bacterium]
MSFVAWILLGLLAGFLGSKIVNRSGQGILIDILLGIVGAVVGGFLFQLVGVKGVTGLNLWSILVATTGAIVLLVVYHAIRGSGYARR